MQQAFLQFVLSALISAITIAALIPLSRKFDWLDHPDERKQHADLVPLVGGFGVFFGIVFIGLYFYGLTQLTAGFALGATLLVVTGALDDRFHIDWKIRILIQIVAALCLVYIAGVRAEHVGPLFGFGDIELGWLTVPFTILITVGLINAINMFDGIDGLVGAVSLAVILMFVCASVYSGADGIASGLFCVLGAIAGFLWYNIRLPWQPKARVFLGDAGSGLIGFTMAFVIFRLTQNPGHPVSPVLGPYLLAPPIIDCLVLIVHRLRRGQSPFTAGRDHSHHLMLDAGFSVGQVVAFMVLLTCITGLFGALAMVLNIPHPVLVMAYLTAMFIWFWITETRQRAISYFQWIQKRFPLLFENTSPA